MKNTNTIAILILVAIVSVAVLSYFLIPTENYDIYEVTDEHDDARTFTVELNEAGYGDEDGAWATLQLAPSYNFGVRFYNVSIPQGVEILDAYVELYSVGTPGHTTPNCKIYCDNTDDAVNFSNFGVLDICGRNYTNSYGIWNATVPYGEWVKSPSITSSVQEVINRVNWTSGNSIAVLFVSEGLRGYAANFQNYENGYPAKLYVVWKEIN